MQAFEESASKLVNEEYIRQGLESIRSHHSVLQTMLSNHKIPKTPTDDLTIELLLHELAAMDSNNFPGNIGAGEREGRVFSSIVKRRHFGFSHGIGRSGDISAIQPKAAGSSLIMQLTNILSLHALRIAGLNNMEECVVLPTATGIALTLCLLSLVSTKPDAKFVIWSRIDQKSCLKCIFAAGLKPIVVPLKRPDDGSDGLETDLAAMEQAISACGVSNIVCVLSTTSCFAPRRPDKVDQIGVLCQTLNIAHVINNAYGLQCAYISKLITRVTAISGRIDYVVQSSDKNFLVPVGGSIVCSPSSESIRRLSQLYPGRASMSPILDLFITFLNMGVDGYRRLVTSRETLLVPKMVNGLHAIARKYNERLLIVPENSISFAITLDNIAVQSESLLPSASNRDNLKTDDAKFLGSMLFRRCVSGVRVVLGRESAKRTIVEDISFGCWGAHYDDFPHSYATAACAIGVTSAEIDEFLEKFDSSIEEFYRKSKRPSPVSSVSAESKQADDSKENVYERWRPIQDQAMKAREPRKSAHGLRI